MSSRPPWVAWTVLWTGIVSASVSAILIRYAVDAPALALSLWRCAAGAMLLAPFARRDLRAASRAEVLLGVLAGVFLALHFATWITSVNLTTVAASVLLVSTTPIFVAGAARLLFGERLTRAIWGGVVLSVGGAALVAGANLSGSRALGNMLALLGAITAGAYFMAAERARRTAGILGFSVVAYAAAAAVLGTACAATSCAIVGYDATTWWAVAGSIIGPQLMGHTLINFALAEIDATTVSVALMAEPLIAGALAFVLFSEAPAPLVPIGGVAILIGIYIVTRARRRATPIPE